MNSLLHLSLLQPLAALPAGSAALAAVASNPQLGFALQLAALGASVGSAVALRAKRRDPDADTWAITTAWSALGLVVGLVVVAIAAVV